MNYIIIKIMGLILVLAALSVFAFILLIFVAIIFTWLGDIGQWYFKLPATIKILLSVAVTMCYFIGSRRMGGLKGIFKSIMNSKEKWE